MMNTVAEYIAEFCSNFPKLFDLDRPELSEPSVTHVALALHSDDVHTGHEIKRYLAGVGLTTEDLHSLHYDGFLRRSGIPLDDAREMANKLKTKGLAVCLMAPWEAEQERKVVAIISWLYKVAQASDGLCRIVCNALTVDRLRRMMRTDCRLNKRLAKDLHDLFLTLMADQSFKMSVARAYAQAFEHFTEDYATGVGTQEMSLYNLSVQFLNRAAFVNEMVDNHTFLESLARALRGMLQQAWSSKSGLDPTHTILVHRRYNPIIGDLKCVFTIPGVSRTFLACCLSEWLEVLELGQYMHPQTRQLTQHVENETREWMNAFNLYLGMSSVFEYLVNWFGAPDAHVEACLANGRRSPSVLGVLQAICTSLHKWHQQYRVQLIPEGSVAISGPSLPPPPTQLSFHLFLHRFFGASIREAVKYPHHTDSLRIVQAMLQQDSVELFTMLDLPLVNILWATRIRLGMWKRNGQVRIC
jgi:hypothetical protein